MELYWSPTSPYVRKVLVLAHETGLFDRLALVSGAGTPMDPNAGTRAYNPLGKVPCLVPANGPAIFDSRVICAYLDSLHEGRRMVPENGEARWRVLTLEALGDGILDAAILAVYENRLRPEDMRYGPWIEAQLAKVDGALDALESRWLAHLAGPLDMGQIAVGTALGYVDFRFADRNWRATRPGLAGWFEGFAARDSMQSTVPPAG